MRRRITLLFAAVILALAMSFGVSGGAFAARTANEQACWGQATKVFAQMGQMGEHASQQDNPRLGLRNLARALHEQGVIEDDTLQALGAFVAGALGLSIEACEEWGGSR